jgi:hypothetical protein
MKMRPLPYVSTNSKPSQTNQKTLHIPNADKQKCVHHINQQHFPMQTCQKCVHHIIHYIQQVSTISITTLFHTNCPPNQSLHFSYTKVSKMRHTFFIPTVHHINHYTFPIQKCQKCVTLFSYQLSTILFPYTFAIQKCQKCVRYMTLHFQTLICHIAKCPYGAFAFLTDIHGHRTLKAPHPV